MIELSQRQIDLIKIVSMIGLMITMLILAIIVFTYEPQCPVKETINLTINSYKEVIN